MQDLEIAMRSKAGLIWVVTNEEMRVERRIAETCLRLKYNVWLWSVTEGITDLDGMPKGGEEQQDPKEAIKFCLNSSQRTAVVMRDLGTWLSAAMCLRQTKDLNRLLPSRPADRALQVIVLDTAEPPKGLSAVVIEWPLPDRQEIGEILERLMELAPENIQKEAKENGAREAIIDAAVGLTGNQVAVGLAKSLVSKKSFDPLLIAAEKKLAVRDSGLEWFDPDPRGMGAVGGLNSLKKWLDLRHAGLTLKGKEYGLPTPKGVLLVGVPGCGKSLTAKCVATSWEVPLMRLDIGALFSKWVGESERTVRQALRLAETVAPCVLWLDELEKSGFGSEGDAGTSQRVFATFLTWMQEREAGVFVVATANDVEKLPPEFMRAGRWDDVFFINLPTEKERQEIIQVLKKKYKQCEGIDPVDLAGISNGYSGAEIEAAITAAMYTQFGQDRTVETHAVANELKQLVPISRSQDKKIAALCKWAEGKARPATVEKATKGDKPAIEMDE